MAGPLKGQGLPEANKREANEQGQEEEQQQQDNKPQGLKPKPKPESGGSWDKAAMDIFMKGMDELDFEKNSKEEPGEAIQNFLSPPADTRPNPAASLGAALDREASNTAGQTASDKEGQILDSTNPGLKTP